MRWFKLHSCNNERLSAIIKRLSEGAPPGRGSTGAARPEVFALPAFAWTCHPFSSPVTDSKNELTLLFSHAPPGVVGLAHPMLWIMAMKVAIPEWQGRVSPVFDVAGHLQVFEIDGESARPIHALVCEEETVSSRVARLVEAGATLLICGAISRPLEMAVTAAGIHVIAQTCGNVQDVAVAYAKGHLTLETFCMPGCGRQERRCHRHGRGNL